MATFGWITFGNRITVTGSQWFADLFSGSYRITGVSSQDPLYTVQQSIDLILAVPITFAPLAICLAMRYGRRKAAATFAVIFICALAMGIRNVAAPDGSTTLPIWQWLSGKAISILLFLVSYWVADKFLSARDRRQASLSSKVPEEKT